eukprot:scaffold26551_cov66-Phaeocystis_antarctica.AAC.1
MVHRHEVDHWPKTTMSPYRKCSRRGLARISLGCGTRVPMKSEQAQRLAVDVIVLSDASD